MEFGKMGMGVLDVGLGIVGLEIYKDYGANSPANGWIGVLASGVIAYFGFKMNGIVGDVIFDLSVGYGIGALASSVGLSV